MKIIAKLGVKKYTIGYVTRGLRRPTFNETRFGISHRLPDFDSGKILGLVESGVEVTETLIDFTEEMYKHLREREWINVDGINYVLHQERSKFENGEKVMEIIIYEESERNLETIEVSLSRIVEISKDIEEDKEGLEKGYRISRERAVDNLEKEQNELEKKLKELQEESSQFLSMRDMIMKVSAVSLSVIVVLLILSKVFF